MTDNKTNKAVKRLRNAAILGFSESQLKNIVTTGAQEIREDGNPNFTESDFLTFVAGDLCAEGKLEASKRLVFFGFQHVGMNGVLGSAQQYKHLCYLRQNPEKITEYLREETYEAGL